MKKMLAHIILLPWYLFCIFSSMVLLTLTLPLFPVVAIALWAMSIVDDYNYLDTFWENTLEIALAPLETLPVMGDKVRKFLY